MSDGTLARLERSAPFAIALYGGFIVLSIALAIAWTPWWLASGVLFAGMAAMMLVAPGRLERRLGQLDEAALGEAD